jgi:hypothetical protein
MLFILPAKQKQKINAGTMFLIVPAAGHGLIGYFT